MPVPILFAALAAIGVVKGLDAAVMTDEAKAIGDTAGAKYKKHLASLEKTRESTQKTLSHLGTIKSSIFKDQIQFLVDALKRSKPASSTLIDYSEELTFDSAKESERQVHQSNGFEMAVTAGAVGGASMAGGVVAMGGIVLGPALAIGGFILASEAEEALTKAKAYSAKIDEACAEMELAATGMAATCTSALELANIISELARRFDMVKVSDDRDPAKFAQMLAVGRALKKSLDISILDKDGKAIKNISTKHAGLLTLN